MSNRRSIGNAITSVGLCGLGVLCLIYGHETASTWLILVGIIIAL